MSLSSITWTPKQINVSDLVENPENPKILNEKGKERLQKSWQQFMNRQEQRENTAPLR